MGKQGKAHTATVNRLAKRFSANKHVDDPDTPDLLAEHLAIEVETAATLVEGVDRLQRVSDGRAYVAVTNREALLEGRRAVHNTGVGLMDPNGEIIIPCGKDRDGNSEEGA